MKLDVLATELNQQLELRKTVNPKFSMRAFARELNLHPSETSEILRGKRRISRDKAEAIISKLKIAPYKKVLLTKKVNGPAAEHKEIRELNVDEYRLIANTEHFCFLALMKTPSFRNEPEWIARKMGIRIAEVYQIIYRLKRLNLITETKSGSLKRNYDSTSTTDDIPSSAIQASHLMDMEKGKIKLKEIPIDMRDFSSLTILVNPKLIPQAKQILRKAQDDIEELMKDSNPDEVYKVCTYLFPLTNNNT